MFLHEEYLNRNSIDLKVIPYVRRAYVVFDDKSSPLNKYICYPDLLSSGERYGVFKIDRVKGRNGPGHFEFSELKAARTGTFSLMRTVVVEWDEYERVLEHELQSISVIDMERGFLLFWEMLCYSFDYWLAKIHNSDLLYNTLDPDYPDRLFAIDVFLSNFQQEKIYWWWAEIRNNYAYWSIEFSK